MTCILEGCFVLFCFNSGKIYITFILYHFSMQFSGIKCFHLVVQPSPPSFPSQNFVIVLT